jgi:hypothetical protein
VVKYLAWRSGFASIRARQGEKVAKIVTTTEAFHASNSKEFEGDFSDGGLGDELQAPEALRAAAGTMDGRMRRNGSTLKNLWRHGSQR